MAVLAGSLAAFSAQANDDRGSSRFDRLDQNGDGEITRAEIEAASSERAGKRANRRADRMFEADANGDGAVTREELKAYRENRNPDKNGDGVIDRAEFMEKAAERFDRLDKNGDGVLSEDERPRRGKRKGKRRAR